MKGGGDGGGQCWKVVVIVVVEFVSTVRNVKGRFIEKDVDYPKCFGTLGW